MRSVETKESSQTLHGTAAEKDQHRIDQEGVATRRRRPREKETLQEWSPGGEPHEEETLQADCVYIVMMQSQ